MKMLSRKELSLTALDHIILLTIITPLVVAFWWGTWTLIDVYLYPEDVVHRSITTTLIGCLGMMSFYCLQNVFAWFDSRNIHFLAWFIFNNIYIIVIALCNVCNWHGIWTFAVIAVGKAQSVYNNQLLWIGILLVTVLTGFITTRTLKNVIAPPIICGMDLDPGLYRCPTRFQQKWGTSGFCFILDCCFSQLLIHTFVPLFWMTSWSIWDIQLSPLSFLENAIVCLTFGTFSTLIVYLLQLPVSKLCKSLDSKSGHWMWRTLVEQLFYLLAGTAAVTSWRGWWMLYTGHLQIGSSEVAGPWLGSVGGLFLLMRILSGSSVLCKGVLIDGGYEEGQGGILNTKYIRYFLDKKLNQNETQEETSEQFQNMPV